MTADVGSAVAASRRPRIPWYHWPIWMLLLGVGLVVFYGVFTPGWMLVRAVAWISERGHGARRGLGGAVRRSRRRR